MVVERGGCQRWLSGVRVRNYFFQLIRNYKGEDISLMRWTIQTTTHHELGGMKKRKKGKYVFKE